MLVESEGQSLVSVLAAEMVLIGLNVHRVAPVLFLWQGADIGNCSGCESPHLSGVVWASSEAEPDAAASIREPKGMGDGPICSLVSCCNSMYVGIVHFVTGATLSKGYVPCSAVAVSVLDVRVTKPHVGIKPQSNL